MTKMQWKKECPGCHKTFNRNRSRKKHILGHTYKGITIPPCAAIPEDKRKELAEQYRLIEVEKVEYVGKAA